MAKHRDQSTTRVPTDPEQVSISGNGHVPNPALADELTFDSLEPREFSFKLRNPGTGELESFVLQEPGASAGVHYQDMKAKAHIIRDNKLVGIDGINEADLDLLTGCVFKRTVIDGNREALEEVNPAYVRSWPYRVYAPLLDRLKEMCPELEGRETVESVDKKIANLQKVRDALTGGTGSPKK